MKAGYFSSLRERFIAWRRRPVDRERVTEWGKLHLGTVLMIAGVYFFKFPNHFTTGGVSGLSIVLSEWIPSLSTATFNLVLNLLLMAVGLLAMGTGFGLKTAYVSLLTSLGTLALEKLVPMETPLTTQPLLELIFAVGLPAVGSAILFDVNASSGGTDVIAMLVKKYTGLNAGSALVIADFVIAAMSCLVFNWETGLYSVLGLFIKAALVDYAMTGLRTYKVFNIVTAQPDKVCDYIIHELHHSATVTEAKGAYTGQHLTNIMTVVNRGQALRLQKAIRMADQSCFVTVSSCSHIVGKGFRGSGE